MRKLFKKKITKKMIKKAYSIELYDYNSIEETEKDEFLVDENELPEEFYKIMGKLLDFVERADQDK
ncbi:MAG: hypothetical protein N4A62_10395 [Marinisporobacter sp.]|jgi:type III secretion system FlhB-like substrate exporter|nr:hypothetical protein [Marinisporobacter sp.]